MWRVSLPLPPLRARACHSPPQTRLTNRGLFVALQGQGRRGGGAPAIKEGPAIVYRSEKCVSGSCTAAAAVGVDLGCLEPLVRQILWSTIEYDVDGTTAPIDVDGRADNCTQVLEYSCKFARN